MPRPTFETYWPAADVERLRALAETTTSYHAAIEMGRSKASLHRACTRLGIRFKRRRHAGAGGVIRYWTASERKKLVIMVGTYSAGDMARELGRSKSAVLQELDRLGVDLLGGGVSLGGASKVLRVSRQTVAKYARRLFPYFSPRKNVSGSVMPGLTLEQVSDIARAIVTAERTEVRTSALHLKRVAEGDVACW